ncbi:MAG: NnrU family protein, partial [Hyphomonas sp.]
MAYLIAGLVVFFGAHLYSAFRSREAGTDVRQKLGYGPYMGLYSLVSLIGLGLIIYGFGQARPSSIIYSPPVWGRHINMLLMVFSMVLIVASNLPTGYIKKATKHPMLVSVKLWALGHLLANGEL